MSTRETSAKSLLQILGIVNKNLFLKQVSKNMKTFKTHYILQHFRKTEQITANAFNIFCFHNSLKELFIHYFCANSICYILTLSLDSYQIPQSNINCASLKIDSVERRARYVAIVRHYLCLWTSSTWISFSMGMYESSPIGAVGVMSTGVRGDGFSFSLGFTTSPPSLLALFSFSLREKMATLRARFMNVCLACIIFLF